MRDLTGITTLLDSLGTSSSSVSIDYSQYAAIKNGSYGKLMKAYYAEEKSDSTSTSSTSSKSSSITTDTTGLTKLKTNSDALKEAAEAVTDSELWSSSDADGSSEKVQSAVKDFVSSYNSVIEQAGKVSSDSVSDSVSWMTSLTSVMQKSLNNIGITIGTDNKLTLDEDALASADSSSLKTLFKGSTSYGSEIEQKASSISSAAAGVNGIYTSDATVTSTLQSLFNTEV